MKFPNNFQNLYLFLYIKKLVNRIYLKSSLIPENVFSKLQIKFVNTPMLLCNKNELKKVLDSARKRLLLTCENLMVEG